MIRGPDTAFPYQLNTTWLSPTRLRRLKDNAAARRYMSSRFCRYALGSPDLLSRRYLRRVQNGSPPVGGGSGRDPALPIDGSLASANLAKSLYGLLCNDAPARLLERYIDDTLEMVVSAILLTLIIRFNQTPGLSISYLARGATPRDSCVGAGAI